MFNTAVESAPATGQPPASREVLAFLLGDEACAIDLLDIREILAYEAHARVAGAPAWVLGVMNLRGHIVPLVDLRCRLGREPACPGPFSVVIVVQHGERLAGVLVDALLDVSALPGDGVQIPSAAGMTALAPYLHGLAEVDGRLLAVIDIAALLQSGAPWGEAPPAGGDRP